jgi:hypothetical protein
MATLASPIHDAAEERRDRPGALVGDLADDRLAREETTAPETLR